MEALREDPSPIEALTVPAIIEHFEAVIDELDESPDHHGPLGRRADHPDPARPRLRGRGRGHRLRARRGHQGLPVSQIRAIFPS